MEDLLLRIVPNLGATWEGATPDEIEPIEELAGRPLPPFYRWFLEKMGKSAGTFSNGVRDLSAWTVLSRYRDGWVSPDPRYLLIGYEHDEMMPMHLFYDLERPARDDALVLSQPVGGAAAQHEFETLREMLAWSATRRFRIARLPQRCRGSFTKEGGDVLSLLNPVMDAIGFARPIPTGAFCGVFEQPVAAMVATVPPADAPKPYLFFELGAPDEGTIRRILGTIAADSSLTVKIDAWDPPIP